MINPIYRVICMRLSLTGLSRPAGKCSWGKKGSVWKRKEAPILSQQCTLKPFVFSLRIYLNAAKSEKARSYHRKNRLTPVALATGWKQTRRGALHSAPAEKVNTAQLQQVSPQKQAHAAQTSPPPPCPK